MQERGHLPVMLSETLEWLQASKGGVFLDLTLGGGGHTQAFLEAHAQNQVFAIDRDENILAQTRQKMQPFAARFHAEHACFSEINSALQKWQIKAFDGILADLGVSSFQLDQAERGFSFRNDGPLDMRMGRAQQSAAEWIHETPEDEMALAFAEYGEERFATQIAEYIALAREQQSFETTLQLADAVKKAVPPYARHGKIHPATRVFQAIRICINQELEELKSLLAAAPQLLKPGGRFVVLAYHSLEDRLVKNTFKQLAAEGEFALGTKRPLVPARAEILQNRRSRSCKMRILERNLDA